MAESGLAKERSMATREKTLRVLVVDDNRDGADAMGLLVEELGNQVHVTYGGTQALDVANAFRPDLMLIDLVMPENGRLRSGHSPSPDCRLRSNENRGHHR
jgi:CheY-like chemotaxis protein